METNELNILNGVINDVAASVYRSEILGNTRLRASMLSQAVQDDMVMTRLRELPVDKREEYMNKAIGALWIEKIISKEYPSKNSSSSSGGSTKIMARVDQAGGATASMFDSPYKEQFTQGSILNVSDGSASKIYDYDDSKETNILRMASIKFPARTGVLTPKVYTNSDAKREEKDENFAAKNTIINHNLDTDKTYTLDGTPLNNLMPGSENYKDFLREHALIEPGSKVDFVYLPTNSDGEPIHAKTYWVNILKVKMRQDYIKALAAVGEKSNVKAEDLVAGSKNVAAYNKYKAWLNSGANLAAAESFYKSENKKSPNHKDAIEAKKNWDLAKLAKKSVDVATDAFVKKSAEFGGVTMRLFGIYTVNYDDSWTNGNLNKAVVAAAKSNKFGSGGVRPATSKDAINNITSLNDVDTGLFVEDIQSLKLLSPVRSMEERLALGEDQTWENRNEVKAIETELTGGVNILSALSNPKLKSVLHILY